MFSSKIIRWACCLILLGGVVAVPYAREQAGRKPQEGLVSRWIFTKDQLRGNRLPNHEGRMSIQLLGATLFEESPTGAIQLRGPDGGLMVAESARAGGGYLPRDALTLSTWVRIDSAAPKGGIISHIQDNGPDAAGLLLGHNEKHFLFGLSSKDGNGLTYLASEAAYTMGRWYHVAATYDGQLMRIYVNGQESGTAREQSGSVVYPSVAPYVIGRYQDDNEMIPLVGAIKSAAVFRRAMSAAEIRSEFDADAQLVDIPPAAGQPFFVINPYLQSPSMDGITIMWETSSPCKATVRYGRNSRLKEKAESEEPTTFHEVRLDGLWPQTKYFYQVSSTDEGGRVVTSPLLTFVTAVKEDSAFSFAVIGDTQRNPVITGKIANLAWKRRPHFLIHVGDVVNDGPIKDQWINDLFRPSAALLGRVPVFPAIGNHERNHAWYYRYFSLPSPEYYYSYRYGNAEFFVIDSNKRLSPRSEQYKWLDEALAKSTAKWKIAYHHHPAYSSEENDYGDTWHENSLMGDLNARFLVRLYEKHDVDVVFNGHIHLYERSWPIRDRKVDDENGIVYVTSGGGGGGLEDFGPTPTWFKAQGRSDYHYCHITIYGNRLSLKAYDQNDMLFDYFDIGKK